MLDWLPNGWQAALTSSTATAIIMLIVGTYFKSKIEKSIQHSFDLKLEKIRSGFRNEEEGIRADLKAKGEQITALRGSALSGLANRYAALDKRRLDAIDKLWTAAVTSGQFKTAAKMVSSIKMEVALDAAAKQDDEGKKLREFATAIWNASGMENLKPGQIPHTERPFLPPLVWAIYSAYSQVLMYPVAQLAAMRSGVGSKLLADPKPLLQLVKIALPHQSKFVDEFGVDSLTLLIEELEETLLREIQRNLHNSDADDASLQQAAAIVKAANSLAVSLNPSPQPPTSLMR